MNTGSPGAPNVGRLPQSLLLIYAGVALGLALPALLRAGTRS